MASPPADAAQADLPARQPERLHLYDARGHVIINPIKGFVPAKTDVVVLLVGNVNIGKSLLMRRLVNDLDKAIKVGNYCGVTILPQAALLHVEGANPSDLAGLTNPPRQVVVLDIPGLHQAVQAPDGTVVLDSNGKERKLELKDIVKVIKQVKDRIDVCVLCYEGAPNLQWHEMYYAMHKLVQGRVIIAALKKDQITDDEGAPGGYKELDNRHREIVETLNHQRVGLPPLPSERVVLVSSIAGHEDSISALKHQILEVIRSEWPHPVSMKDFGGSVIVRNETATEVVFVLAQLFPLHWSRIAPGQVVQLKPGVVHMSAYAYHYTNDDCMPTAGTVAKAATAFAFAGVASGGLAVAAMVAAESSQSYGEAANAPRLVGVYPWNAKLRITDSNNRLVVSYW